MLCVPFSEWELLLCGDAIYSTLLLHLVVPGSESTDFLAESVWVPIFNLRHLHLWQTHWGMMAAGLWTPPLFLSCCRSSEKLNLVPNYFRAWRRVLLSGKTKPTPAEAVTSTTLRRKPHGPHPMQQSAPHRWQRPWQKLFIRKFFGFLSVCDKHLLCLQHDKLFLGLLHQPPYSKCGVKQVRSPQFCFCVFSHFAAHRLPVSSSGDRSKA